MKEQVKRFHVGQKVTLLYSKGKPHKQAAAGHICRIFNVVSFVWGPDEECKYELEWYQEDNPDKQMPFLITRYFFYENDMELVKDLNLSATVKSHALPDV